MSGATKINDLHICLLILAIIASSMAQKKTVSTILLPPYLEANTKPDGTVEYQGYIRDLLDEVSKITNILFQLSIRNDSKFGQRFGEGNNITWDGLIGDVYHGKTDIAVGPLTETAERRQAVDFSTPFKNFGNVVVMKRPHSPTPSLLDRLQMLFAPIASSVWLMSFVGWLAMSASLYFICHINPYEWRHLAKDRQATLREAESFTCFNSFWFTMSTFVWQGFVRAPRSTGGRMVVAFWWAYVYVFLIMYVASMTNYLRYGPNSEITHGFENIQTIQDLAGQSSVSYGILKGGSTEEFFRKSSETYIKKAHRNIKAENDYVESIEEGVQRVRKTWKEAFAFVTESSMAKYFTKKGPCDLYMVGDFVTAGSYAFAFKQNKKLEKQLDLAILTLRENGKLKALDDLWFSGQCHNYYVDSSFANKAAKEPFNKVDLATFSGALLILVIGAVLGLLCTVLEVIVYRKVEKEEKDARGKPKKIPSEDLSAQKEQQHVTDV